MKMSFPTAWLWFLVAAATVSGCARTNVDAPVAMAIAPVRLQPHTVAIIVTNESAPPDRPERYEKYLDDSRFVETELTKQLSSLLAARQLVVVSPERAADLTLDCRIVELRGGSKALRLLVGFGAGRATLRMRVALIDSSVRHGATFLSFETSGTSGRMPGSGVSPRGLASAAVTSLMKEGLAKEVDQARDRIDEELAKYFGAEHWPYPKPAENEMSRLIRGQL